MAGRSAPAASLPRSAGSRPCPREGARLARRCASSAARAPAGVRRGRRLHGAVPRRSSAARTSSTTPSLIAAAVRMLQDRDQPGVRAPPSLRPRLRRRVPGHRPGPGRAAARSLAGDGRDLVVGRRPAPVDLRLPGRGGAGDPRVPARCSRGPTASRPRQSCWARPVASGPTSCIQPNGSAARLPLPAGVPRDALNRFLHPSAEADDDGRVELLTYDTDRAEAEHLADLLRRAHLEDGDRVVRHGGARPLRAHHDPRAPSRTARRRRPSRGRDRRHPTRARACGRPTPGCALDRRRCRRHRPVRPGVRRPRARRRPPCLAACRHGRLRREVLARTLRARERIAAEAESRSPRPSPDLLRDALLEPGTLADVPTPGDTGAVRWRSPGWCAPCARARRRGHRRAGAVGAVGRHLLAGPSAGSTRRGGGPGPDRLTATSTPSSRSSTPPRAPRTQRGAHASAEAFLDTLRAQQIPADTLAERGCEATRSGCSPPTAPRGSSGDARRRRPRPGGRAGPTSAVARTLLHADRIGGDRLVPPTRRASCSPRSDGCSTSRAPAPAGACVVTAVASPDDDGEQPSRFLAELGADGSSHVEGRPRARCRWPGWSPSCAAYRRRPRVAGPLRDGRCRTPGPAAPQRAPRRRPLGARRRPGDLVGDPRAAPSATAAPRPPTSRSRLSASALTACRTARRSGSSTARPEARARQHRGPGLRQRRPRPRRPHRPRASWSRAARSTPSMALRRPGLGPDPVPTPWSGGRERDEVGHALDRFLVWHERPRPRAGRPPRSRCAPTVDAAGRRRGAAARVRGPARGRRRRPRRRGRPQDRQGHRRPAPRSPSTPSSGSTSSPSRTVRSRSSAGRRAGWRELWQLRQEAQRCGSGPAAGSRRSPTPTASVRSSGS